MKNLFTLTLLACIVFACSPEEDIKSQVNKNDLEEFSKANTDGSKFVTDLIKEQNFSDGRISEEALTEGILSATTEYLISEGFSEEDIASSNAYLENVLNSDEEPFYDAEVTELQASFIAALELAFDQETDFEGTIALIEGLEKQAHELLSDEEIGLVLMATTTAKSQAEYWYNNEFEVTDSEGRVQCVSSWRQVGVKAVAGAMGGAASCGVARFFGPVGWKVWGACIVGGAVGVAVEDMVEQCLSPTKAAYDNCMRYTGGSYSACGGLLNYNRYIYGTSPYQLLNLPIQSFP